jgi:hypothetical protein
MSMVCEIKDAIERLSYGAWTSSAAKRIFEAILRWKCVNVRPTRREI